jgi:murein L,D-transpeptidase YcbB/YkuD
MRHFAFASLWAAVLAGCGMSLCAGRGLAQDTLSAEPATTRLSLELNIPAFRLDVRQDGRVIHSYTVAVGMRRYATPTGDFQISNLVWNPWWYPPDGQWAKNDTVTPPGPRNPMGKAKLSLGGPYFVHGTPTVSSLGKAASHGCIRMHNDDVVQLALLAEQHHGAPPMGAVPKSPSWDWSHTRTVRLADPIPVRIIYELAEVRDSLLIVYPDVYRRAGGNRTQHVMDALRRAGVDSVVVSREAIARLLEQSATKPARIPLSELEPPVTGGRCPAPRGIRVR